MTPTIHPTAIIDPSAELGVGVEIGAYAWVGAQVKLGDNTIVSHHASINGPIRIGKGNYFFPFASIGEKTQDLKYKGEPTFAEIGDNNVFREFTTVNRGTAPEAVTLIGSNNLFLTYSHVAHDCIVGNHTIFSNNATLAGHVEVGDHAIISGLSAIHQFCRIGEHAIVGGCTKIVQDVPPFFIADGNPAEVRGVNAVGLQRNGFPDEDIKVLRTSYKILYDNSLNTSQALERLEGEFFGHERVKQLIDFVRSSQRGIIR